MSVLTQDINDEISALKTQIEKLRLTHKETSFKFRREHQILKRLVTSLASACITDNNHKLSAELLDVKTSIEDKTEITALLPKIARLENTLKQQTLTMEKQQTHLDPQLRQGGEMLLHLPGLPAKLKRDLRDLLNFPNKKVNSQEDQAIRLLGLYERSIKIIASNPHMSDYERNHSSEQLLLSRLSQELQTLITELDFEGEYGEQLHDISAKLLIGVSVTELLDLTLEILRLVVSGTELERKTSEQFLNELNTSLSTQLKSSAQNIEKSHSHSANRKEMYRDLTSLVTRSQHVIFDNHDIDIIKSKIKPMYSELVLVVERLTDTEQREQTLIERMKYQQSQIKALYDTTQDYKKRLEEQTERIQQDPLTKILNRNAFHNKLDHEYHRWIKNQHSLRIVLLDIDNFKHLNDQFGYSAGDKALKIIARCIRNNMPSNAVLARFAGEEFILMISETDSDLIHKAIQSVQKSVSELPFKFKNKNIEITLSGASTEFNENDSPEEILDRVRQYLNQAKQSGPNRLYWK